MWIMKNSVVLRIFSFESYTLKIILAVKVQQKLIRKRPALASENATNDERAPPVA